MYFAPSVLAAVSSAAYSPLPVSLAASTRSILHSGQIAEAMSMSSDSSSVQLSLAGAVGGQRRGLALLVVLSELARRQRGEPGSGTVRGQVAGGRRVVVGVDDRHRRPRAVCGGSRGQAVSRLELRRPVTLSGGDRVGPYGLRVRMDGRILDDEAGFLPGLESLAAGKHPVGGRRW